MKPGLAASKYLKTSVDMYVLGVNTPRATMIRVRTPAGVEHSKKTSLTEISRTRQSYSSVPEIFKTHGDGTGL